MIQTSYLTRRHLNHLPCSHLFYLLKVLAVCLCKSKCTAVSMCKVNAGTSSLQLYWYCRVSKHFELLGKLFRFTLVDMIYLWQMSLIKAPQLSEPSLILIEFMKWVWDSDNTLTKLPFSSSRWYGHFCAVQIHLRQEACVPRRGRPDHNQELGHVCCQQPRLAAARFTSVSGPLICFSLKPESPLGHGYLPLCLTSFKVIL